VAKWQRTGREVIVVKLGHDGAHVRTGDSMRPAERWHGVRRPTRVLRAMLMGDIRGFSKLTDEQLPPFSTHVLGAFASVLSVHDADIEYRNTWGDALFVVLSGATVAARCALDLQEAMAALDFSALGLPPNLAFRLSGHLGPVYPIVDPVLDRQSFMGSHVNRTARIEPVTLPGAVYVTESFAAAVELADSGDIGCDYVGHLPMAKDYGRLRMYRIWRQDDRAALMSTNPAHQR
jgi:class 3 adenylate cyclase